MKIATWNIDGINGRLELLLAWLAEARPDAVALQETKTVDGTFPRAALEAAGYGAIFVGERRWNGVALLARDAEPVPVRRALPGDAQDRQARFLEGAVQGVLVAALYLPNGNPQPGPKFDAKLAWFRRLNAHAATLWETGLPVVLAGDFNVVPTARDIYPTRSYDDNALVQPAVRAARAELMEQGWCDAVRTCHPEAAMYSFWGRMRQRWPRDAGLRIDHLLLSAPLAPRLLEAGVDRDWRGREGASEHAPVWARIAD